jgi:hypothetical protein
VIVGTEVVVVVEVSPFPDRSEMDPGVKDRERDS